MSDCKRLMLAERQTMTEFEARLREKLPALAERLNSFAPDRKPEDPVPSVLATRPLAHEFIAAHPEVRGAAELDCTYVACVSPPFVHEILKAWPEAVFVNANEDVADTVAFVRSRMRNA